MAKCLCDIMLLPCLRVFATSRTAAVKFPTIRLKQRIPTPSNHTQRRAFSNDSPHQTRLTKKQYIFAVTNFTAFLIGAVYVIKRLIEKKSSEPELLNDPYLKKDAESFKYKNYWLPLVLLGGENTLKDISEFEVRETDIYVASFPKSGTTWVQEVIFRIVCSDPTQTRRTMEERFPYLEFIYPGLRELGAIPSPRLLKTHLPYELMPEELKQHKGKVVYIARNPKDVSVSYYHFVKMLKYASYRASFKAFHKSFVEGRVNYGPWPDHVLGYWKARDEPNVLFITYEELQEDLAGCVEKIAAFLGVSVSKDGVEDIARHCTFPAMRDNNSTNYSWWERAGYRNKKQAPFMRKGKVGDWKNYYTTEMAEQMDKVCTEQLTPHGLVFLDEIKS